MGNLRDKYTNEEWDEIENQIKRDKLLGKPEQGHIAVWVDKLTIKQLKKLKKKLKKCGIDSHDCSKVDQWITYNENKERVTNKTNA
jgi:hypothetical protein